MKKGILISSLVLATALAANAREIFDSLRTAATTSTSISETTVSLASDLSNREDRPSRKGGPSNLLAQSSPQVKNGSANAAARSPGSTASSTTSIPIKANRLPGRTPAGPASWRNGTAAGSSSSSISRLPVTGKGELV